MVHSKYNSVLLKYILNIVAYAALWYLAPLIALTIFILITAYHFGEIDWLGYRTKMMHRGIYFMIGLCWILYFLSININTALKIFSYVGGSTISSEIWLKMASYTANSTFILLLLIHGLLFIFKKRFYFTPTDYYFSLLQLGVLMCICHFSPLWIGFGFYFGVWHSILSFDRIRSHLGWKNDFNHWMKLLKLSIPFSVMAWIGMLFVMFMFFNSKNHTSLISLLFMTLSVLTLPHLQVFTKLKVNREGI